MLVLTRSSRAGVFCLLGLLIFDVRVAGAGSAAWSASPTNGDWNTAANWVPATVPGSPGDTATFASSNTTDVFLSAFTEVSGVVFSPGAGAFTITTGGATEFTLSSVGMTNTSGLTQTFVIPATSTLAFTKHASAGTATKYIANGAHVGDSDGGLLEFHGSSTAGSSTIEVDGGAFSGTGLARAKFVNLATAGQATITNHSGVVPGVTQFFLSSTAGDALITNQGGSLSGSEKGQTFFNDSSSGGDSTIINSGGTASGASGGLTIFSTSAGSDSAPDAGNATLIANGGSNGGGGGSIQFQISATGGTSRVEVFGNGSLDTSGEFMDVTIGSFEGDGVVWLGSHTLIVGTNNLDTTFSGLLRNGGYFGGGPGSLSKTGSGTLTLTGASIYTGTTSVSEGVLILSNTTGSATGTGPVTVNSGTLGGSGIVEGGVTVGTGRGEGAFLAPAAGTKNKVTFTTLGPLNLQSDATYIYTARGKGRKAQSDKVIAKGVTIAGAKFSFQAKVQGALSVGAVFTAINNTAATPISGSFANLPDGGIVTVGSQ